jgi:DNA-binding transcriptional MerR regulator
MLSIAAAPEERELGTALRLDIISFVRDGGTGAKAIRRMLDAERAGPTNADVVEGLSGMRKLQKMKLDKTLLRIELHSDPSRPREVRVTTWFALTGLV